MDGYETMSVRKSTKKRLKTIMKYGTTYDRALNTLITEHIELNRGGC